MLHPLSLVTRIYANFERTIRDTPTENGFPDYGKFVVRDSPGGVRAPKTEKCFEQGSLESLDRQASDSEVPAAGFYNNLLLITKQASKQLCKGVAHELPSSALVCFGYPYEPGAPPGQGLKP